MAHKDREPLRHHLLWTDLECTGSDEAKDEIIEIGCVLTTYDLVELGTWTAVVQPRPEALGRMMLNDVVRQMHTKNGLLEEVINQEGWAVHTATQELLDWLRGHEIKKGDLVIAGSGVGHYDSRFIKKFMPQLMPGYCKYWVIDIGNIRRAWDMWVGTDVSSANDGKTHRALDDAKCHLEEARAFANLWRQQSSDQAAWIAQTQRTGGGHWG
jgi:oligoribonuclease (3'-5' exoribonuclease)